MEMQWGGGIVAGNVMVTVTVTVTSCDLVICESSLPYVDINLEQPGSVLSTLVRMFDSP